jgi:hypothetical protein
MLVAAPTTVFVKWWRPGDQSEPMPAATKNPVNARRRRSVRDIDPPRRGMSSSVTAATSANAPVGYPPGNPGCSTSSARREA